MADSKRHHPDTGQTRDSGGRPPGAEQTAVGGRRSAVIRQRSSVAGLSLYLLLTIAITHPLWLHLTDAVPGDIGDPLLNTWILAWDAHALLTDPLHLFDANIFYPLPNTLAYSEHLFSTAVLALPLGLVAGEPVLAYNLSLLLSFPLAGLGMYLLVLHWTHRRGAAFLAGLAFAFAPYRLAATAHLQLLTVQWLPFSLLALDRLLKYQIPNIKYPIPNTQYPIPNPWLPFILFTILQILASWYLAVFTALVLGLYTLGWLVGRWQRGWYRLAQLFAAALIVAGLTLPFALPYLDVLPQLQAARPAMVAASFAARPTDFLAAAPFLRFPGPLTQTLAARPGFTEENTLFLGVVAPLLALIGLIWARPRWRTAPLAAILVVSLALTFAGPYGALTRVLPALTVVRVPPRWIIPATFALAALAGLGVARLDGRRQTVDSRQGTPSAFQPYIFRLARLSFIISRLPSTTLPRLPSTVYCLLLSLLLIAESFAAPLPLAPVGTRADLPPVYHVLRGEALREPPEWGVIELPMYVAPAPEFPEVKRLVASTLGWWGLVNGYSGFTPERQMTLDRGLANFPSDEAFTALRALAAGDGVRYLVVHPGESPLDRTRWETNDRWQIERQASLLPVGRFGPDDLYLINPYGEGLITDPTVVTDAYWSAHTPLPANVRFTPPASNAGIHLLAYLLQPEDWMLGGDLSTNSHLPTQTRLTLYWQTSTPLDTDYTVFVHSLNADGELVGQADGPPVADHYPTTAWRPGEIVQDSRLVPPGDRYLVGLYDPLTGERLPAFAADGARLANDAVVVTTGQR